MFPEVFGLDEYAISRAERLPAFGRSCLDLFLFGGHRSARAGANFKAVVCDLSGLGTTAPNTESIVADHRMIPPERRTVFEAEMPAAEVDWQIHLDGSTVYSFTNSKAVRLNMPDAIRYKRKMDVQSWAALQALFAETLG